MKYLFQINSKLKKCQDTWQIDLVTLRDRCQNLPLILSEFKHIN